MFVFHPSQINAVPEHGVVNAGSTGVLPVSHKRKRGCRTALPTVSSLQPGGEDQSQLGLLQPPPPSMSKVGAVALDTLGGSRWTTRSRDKLLYVIQVLWSLGQRWPPALWAWGLVGSETVQPPPPLSPPCWVLRMLIT